MTGINYYIKFFSDGVSSQWLDGYGIRYDKMKCRGFGIWRDNHWSAIVTKKNKVLYFPHVYIGLWWVFRFRLMQIPSNPKWNGW